eukprot:5730655-Prymnesium_polylepis.1
MGCGSSKAADARAVRLAEEEARVNEEIERTRADATRKLEVEKERINVELKRLAVLHSDRIRDDDARVEALLADAQ